MDLIDGLHTDIKLIVLVQCLDLNATSTLALLLEEVTGVAPVQPQHTGDWHAPCNQSAATKVL